jgi:hypothetical protein
MIKIQIPTRMNIIIQKGEESEVTQIIKVYPGDVIFIEEDNVNLLSSLLNPPDPLTT